MTGPQAANGVDNRDGVLLAIKEINAKGVKIGGKPVVFELDINDDGADPKQGVQIAQSLSDKKIKFVMGPYNSGVTMPAARVLNDSDIVVLTVASNPKITEMGYNNLFRIGASDNQLGTKMATYAAQDLKIKTVAVIDDRTAYGQGVAREFTEQAKRLGVKVVASEFTTDKATDFSSILTNIRASKADAVFYGGYSPRAARCSSKCAHWASRPTAGPVTASRSVRKQPTCSQISGDSEHLLYPGWLDAGPQRQGPEVCTALPRRVQARPADLRRRFSTTACTCWLPPSSPPNRPTPRRLCRPSPTASTLA